MAAAVDWAGLPRDLLDQISKHIKVMEDFIAFRGVCISWRIASPKDNFDHFSPQFPLLMLPDKEDDYREFYSLSKGKVSRVLYLPEARGRECFPSDQPGWLLTQSYDGEEVTLLNLFSRAQIQLPNQFALRALQGYGKFPEEKDVQTIRNATLSANPSFTSDYVLVIAYNTDVNHLAFWRPGDLNWTRFDVDDRVGGVSNMIYYKGQFYLVTWGCEICIVDVPKPNVPEPPQVESRLIRLNDTRDLLRHTTQYYLVEVHNVLLFVARFADSRPDVVVETNKCAVYEVDLTEDKLKEINTLGNSAIFLGLNGATSIDTTEFTGVKPDHIYFTDDWFEEYFNLECGGGKDMGAYNLEDGTIESFYPGLSQSRTCPPTWVIPSL